MCLEGLWGGVPSVARDWVIVDQPPVAIALAEPNKEPAPLEVQLDGTLSFDPEGGALLFNWQFADGSPPAMGPTVTRFYPIPEYYEVTLTVTDDYEQTNAVWFEVKVLEPPPDLPAFAPWAFPFLASLLLGVGSWTLRRRSHRGAPDGRRSIS